MMTERITQFTESLGISIRAFEQQIGASNGLIRKAITNKTDIQSKWLASIAENYPRINIEWLLTGKGKMLKDGSSDHMAIDLGASQSESTFPLYLPNNNDKRIDIQQIPLYEIEASAGLSMLFTNQSSQVPVGFITI
ncbi:MAG: hypothetical protein LBV72_14720, partial [Tannerella sp.]|nr:hypothetical protein [Tannerella sp.]